MFNFDNFLQLTPIMLGREKVFTASPSSPIIIEWWKPHPVYRLHHHVGFEEFAIVRHGFCIHYHRNQFELLTLGDAAFIGKTNPHGYVFTNKMALFNIVFSSQYFVNDFPQLQELLKELKELSLNNIHLKISPRTLKQILLIVYTLENECSQFDNLSSVSMLSSFLQVTLMMLRDNNPTYNSPSKLPPNHDPHLEELIHIIDMIRNNIHKPIKNITDIIDDSHLNTKTMQRYFQKNLHISLYQFITLQKLVITMNTILKNPKESLVTITEEMGYSNYRSFARNIDNFFQLSPKRFQEKVLAISNLTCY
ncbi:MAG: helix-turn-helix domain-containing protein [Pasteurella sp.]|nr:helix-turn-helix domain-containing protein [Pasteurella sp.]